MLPDTPRVRSRLDLLYVVTREFNAGLDIDQVLNRVITATLATVGASDASLFLFDPAGQLENFFQVRNFQVEKRRYPDLEGIINRGLVGWIKEHKEGAIIQDTSADARWYTNGDDGQFSKPKSAVGVPIQLPDQLIGILTLTAPQPNYFDQSDLAMLAIMADQAAFAIINARLFKAEQHRRRLADTLTSVARTINSTFNLEEVLDLILEKLALVIDYDSSSVLLFDEDGKTLSVRAARNFEDMDDALNVKIPVNKNSPNYLAIMRQEPIVIADVDEEPGWIKTSSSLGVHSWIGAPLMARDEVVGMLTVDSYEVNKYADENSEDVAAFANLVATAVANAQIVTRLKNAETSYSTLFEDSTDMIVISTYDGLILDANRMACQMLRRTKDALMGNDINFVIDSRLGEHLTKQNKRLKTWREISFEMDILDAYRQAVSLEVKARQVHYAGKKCIQWVGRDISARKEAEKLRQDLINMVIHDLRGPLGNLINTIELMPMLLEATQDIGSLRQLLNLAMQTSQDVRDLVDSMLDIGRLEQGEVPLQQSLIDVQELVQAVARQVAPRAKEKLTNLTIEPLPEMFPIWIDGSMIRRVLINLIDNAIKYTPSQGNVTLTATLNDNTLNFAIADNGPGISKTDQVHIFDKFSRVDYSSEAPSGIGLGLAFCKLATEAHGGKIRVESEGLPGQGSTFYLSIPLIFEPQK
ncbi:MAG: GAF domain-containing protein [Chloroflexota bacterium]